MIVRSLDDGESHNMRVRSVYASELLEDPPDGIAAGPVDEDNMFLWEAMILYVLFV